MIKKKRFNLYEEKLKFARSLGFRRVVDAINHYSLYKFEILFRESIDLVSETLIDYSLLLNKVSKENLEPDYNSLIKDTEIDSIKDLLSNGITLKRIGFIYKVSEMSVHRFIKRNKLEKFRK